MPTSTRLPGHRNSALLTLTLLTQCLLLTGCLGRPEVVPGPVAASGAPAAGSSVPSDRSVGVRFPASEVLASWDQARARAYADGDVRALRRLYADGSAAGRSDVRVLRAYKRRGLVVTGMQVQLLAVDVLEQSPDRLRVRVTDRLTRAVALGRYGGATPLPRDGVSTRVVELARADARSAWRVVRVRE